jgi:hypothetical protein
MKLTIAPGVVAVVVALAAGRVQDGEARARELAKNIGGLREDFTESDFLDRAAVQELLALDWESVKPLEEVLLGSSDWSARATAAYLLTQLDATACFHGAWRRESSVVAKIFLYRGVERHVADYGPYVDEINNSTSVSEAARDRLRRLAAQSVPLNEAQQDLRLRKLAACLGIPDDPRRTPAISPWTSRAITILSGVGPPAVPYTLSAFHTARSEDTELYSLMTLTNVVVRIDVKHEAELAAIRPHLEQILGLADSCARHRASILRDRSCELLFGLAVVLEATGGDSSRLVSLLSGLASSDAEEGTRKAAAYWLSRWREREEAKLRGSGEKSAHVPVHHESARDAQPAGSGQQAGQRAVAGRASGRPWIVTSAIIAVVFLALILALRFKRT